MALLQHAVAVAREYLWGFPMLALLFGTHLYFTFHLGFIQKKIPLGIRLSLTGTKNQEKDQVTPYSALATALAATIGTGNIVGISTAIAIGGPGAVFWCWLTGVFGIATCYAECYLSIRYRVRRADNTFAGGPMYILDRRLKKRKLAAAFAVFTLFASFGIGSSVQSYSIRTALQHQITVSPHLVGMAVGVLAGIIIIGGNSQIAKVCMWLVPLMSAFYVGGCLYIIGRNRAVLPETLALILSSAVCPKAVAGGCTGGALLLGIQTGVSRGLFTNEAGLGSIPMVAATAASSSDSPKEAAVRQALISMTGPFWDTVVLCAITGIAAVGSMVSHPQEYRGVAPENMCFVAFRELPVGGEWMALDLSDAVRVCHDHRLECVRNLRGALPVGRGGGACLPGGVHVFRLSGSGAFHGACVGDIGSAEFPDGSAESVLPVDAARRNCHRLWKRDR